jgi:nitroreductase
MDLTKVLEDAGDAMPTNERPAPECNFEEFEKVVRSRRSIRRFTSERIPDDVMAKILEMALLAPSSSNLQPAEFYWTKTDRMREGMVEVCLSQPAAKTAGELIAIIGRTSRWKVDLAKMVELLKLDNAPPAALMYYEKLLPLALRQGPLDIFGHIKRLGVFARGLTKPTPREPVSRHHMELWAVKSASLAAENLMLAARAAGYDSCPMEGYDSARLKRLLKLPSDAVPVMVVALGKRAPGGVYGKQVRFEREILVHEV